MLCVLCVSLICLTAPSIVQIDPNAIVSMSFGVLSGVCCDDVGSGRAILWSVVAPFKWFPIIYERSVQLMGATCEAIAISTLPFLTLSLGLL